VRQANGNCSPLKEVINSLFEAKPPEKRQEWISSLESEEFETAEELVAASEVGILNICEIIHSHVIAWEKLKLPLAIKDKI
jgi:hypothetical protein